MPETADHPVAVRATAFIRPSRWLHRPVRLVRYDAYWADGRVDFGVDLSKMMYRGYPADFATVDESVHAQCPETGTGRWVDEAGRVVEGPTRTAPIPPGNGGGERRKYGVPRYQVNTKANRAWRLGCGVVGLSVGTFLIAGPMKEGIAGFLGLLCFIFGLALLAGLIPGSFRWWEATSRSAPSGADRRMALMGSERITVESVRDDIISAIAEVRSVARAEHDEGRNQTADWLDVLFAGVNDAHGLREAAAEASTLYGGWGSFADVGTAESERVVSNLWDALERARSFPPRDS
ncbi:hypothetical protein QFZ35_000088 [Arthrobacter ulcerisalmonis]|uniref:hypothetical protein n=1 Tax=Arthrobacter sp. B1I2 TaxID=3042263 RepID=UPI00278AF392|nr:MULTISPECIES: hypothetical protein [Arthrobacter]MDQ0661590.1 hypothetical protein [Arthrobacter ulcerisalmonis]MDQ0729501.1 hypothetical protein [Arthrobacter sp. B1I2]